MIEHCAGILCRDKATATAFVNKKQLRGEHGGPPMGPDVFQFRVIGWFRYMKLPWCSLFCYIGALNAEYYGHLVFCDVCNYDKDCMWCSCGDGTEPPEHHACNCTKGPGHTPGQAGWGYYRRKLIDRLKEKLERRVCIYQGLKTTASSD